MPYGCGQSLKSSIVIDAQMKNLLLLLLLVGCTEAEFATEIVGEWQITWSMPEGSRTGILTLNNDRTGEIRLEKDPKSPILPNAEKIDIRWNKSNENLILTRIDNDFVLNYQIKNRTENSIDLSFAGDINILLIRQ